MHTSIHALMYVNFYAYGCACGCVYMFIDGNLLCTSLLETHLNVEQMIDPTKWTNDYNI